MPLRRRFRDGRVVSTVGDVYQDRLSRWSDIQEYLPLLHDMAKEHPRVLELGTRGGNSTVAFLAAVEGNCCGHVTSVDVNPCTRIGKHPQWTFIQGDDTDPQIYEKIYENGPYDLLFVDTSHYYEHTKQECFLYLPLVEEGGVALFHDTRLFPHPHEYEWSEKIPPVRKALDDYCTETGFAWKEIPGEYGLGVLEVA